MVRWIKLYGNQYLGFWILGFALFALQEIPYMIMPLLKLKENPIMTMQESSVILDICEKILGILCIVSMSFIIHGQATLFSVKSGRELLFFCIAMGTILLNFFGWFLYFTGHQSIFIMIFYLVMLPPLYYFFIGLWRNNTILTITGCIFLIVHTTHVMRNLYNG